MARGKLRRGLGIAGLTAIAAMVSATLLALGLLLYTEGGTRLAVEIGRRLYDDSIPGGVTVGSISGRLGDRFLMRGVTLRDRAGTPLISVRELEVEWSPLSMLGGRLIVERVTIRGAEVRLDRGLSGAGFADLAPVETAPATIARGLGPDLPFALLARVRLEDATVSLAGADGNSEAIAHVAALELSLAATATRARLTVVNASGSAPSAGSADLDFAVDWDEPIVMLTGLRATTDFGSLSIRVAAFDVTAQVGVVEAFVDVDAGAVKELFGISLEQDVAIPVSAFGGPESFRASLAVMDGPEVAIEISATGSARPVLDVRATMDSAGGVQIAAIHSVLDRRLSDGRVERACAAVEIDDLSLLTGALSHLFDLPEIGGALGIEATCGHESGALVCRGDARGRDLRFGANGVRSANLDLGLRPLDPALPFDAHLAADGLELSGLRISHLDATAAGTTDEMDVALRAAASGGDLLRARATVDLRDGVAVTLRQLSGRYRGTTAQLARPATVSYRQGSLAVRDLELRIAGGTVTVDGDVRRDAESDFTARIAGVRLERLATLVPGLDLAGEIDARLVVEGTMRSPRATLSASVRRLSRRELVLGDVELFASMSKSRLFVDLENEDGIAESLRLLAEAEIVFSPQGARAIRFARGGFNDVELVAKGLRLDLLRTLLPGVEIDGVADVDARLRGGPDNPYVRLEIGSRKVAWRGVVVAPFELLAEHSDGAIAAELRMDGGPAGRIEAVGQVPIRITLDAPPLWRRDRSHEVDASAVGLDLHTLRQIAAWNGVEIGELPVDGLVDLKAVLKGTPSSPVLEALLSSGDLSWRSQRLGGTKVRLELGRGRARLHAQVVQAEGRWADLVASAPCDIEIQPFEFRWDNRGAHELRLQAVGIDKAVLSPFLEAPAGSDLRLDMVLDGAGNIDEFAVRGEWNGRALFEKGDTVPFRGTAAADLRHQSVHLEIGSPGSTVASVTARTEIAVGELLRGEGRPEDVPLAAKIRMPGLDLKPLGFLLPTGLYGIEGMLRGDVVVDGTIGAPRVRGYATLEDGAITVVEMGQRLRNIDVRASMDGRRIVFREMTFSSGEGRGTADGELVLSDGGSTRVSVDARLRQFPFVKPGLPNLTLDSKVTFSATRDRKSTEALIALRGTRIKLLTKTPSRAPARLPPAGEITFLSLETGVAPEALPDSRVDDSKDSRPLKLVIDVSDPIEITGPDVSMRWSGSVTAASASGRNAVSGRIAAEGGRFWLLNNSFVIDSGEVSLPATGPLDPYIRLVARTETQAALVTVEIKGRLSRPDLTLTSDPAMNQYQILTLLLTGRSDTGEGGENGEEVRAQAASLLLALNNPVLEQQLNDRLGVDRIGLSMGEDVDEPVVAVGKRLGRHFYVETEYHHNAPSTENRAGGRVEYYINPRWSIETFYGDANKGGIDLFWHKRFGRPKPKPRPLVLPAEPEAAASTP
ncbi:MAG: translocation/assembly module TamB [Proteobacteria bacterium]|jgi:hypothetical protein|nr:translocation/assembly module TamB [Pseudomonadota bacterium]